MIKETSLTKTLRIVARWFVGLVFLFSSFTKGVDPMGTAYKVEEYMTAWSFFGLSFEGFLPLAPFLSMTLICLEFLVGVLMLTGSFRKLSAWLLLLMMAFFTCTTLYDAITNEVSDCGCFGDAVKLTNWQTFWKNIVLDVPTLFIFLTRRWPRRKRLEQDTLIAIAAVAVMVIFGLYNINNEPLIDFRPWKVGNVMFDNIDETLPVTNIATYTNTQTGEAVTFDMKQWKDYQAVLYDTTGLWHRDTIITRDPHEIRADGFWIQDPNGDDMTFDVIGALDGPMLLCSIHHLKKVTERGINAIAEMRQFAMERGIRFAVISNAEQSELLQFLYGNTLMDVEYYFGDEKALETMLRSNPGFIVLQNATVKGKWHYHNVNKIKDFPFEIEN